MKLRTIERGRGTALLSGVAAALVLAAPARAADANPAPSSVGPPIVLFSPNSADATHGPAPKAVATAPTIRATVPQAHAAPVAAKPLLPAATVAAKLSPPPEPRPALPLETVIRPLAAPPQPAPPGEASPLTVKASSN